MKAYNFLELCEITDIFVKASRNLYRIMIIFELCKKSFKTFEVLLRPTVKFRRLLIPKDIGETLSFENVWNC